VTRWPLIFVVLVVAGTIAFGAPSKKKRRTAPARPDAGTSRALRFGTLEIKVRGSATVFVDDRELGKTPVKTVTLLEGSHRVRFVNEELGLDQTQTVEIHSGQATTLEVSFEG
jgi:hypothetical protein